MGVEIVSGWEKIDAIRRGQDSGVLSPKIRKKCGEWSEMHHERGKNSKVGTNRPFNKTAFFAQTSWHRFNNQ